MLREGSLEDISDGRLYSDNDMVKADTNDCSGCNSLCCRNMEDTIKLDPYDVYRLTMELGLSFEELMSEKIELNISDMIILPNLKMDMHSNACAFLDTNNRCQIHNIRPGFCRLFPLGRYWEDEENFKYILQTGQCHKTNLSKIKVKKWLDTKELNIYNQYICSWHKYLSRIRMATRDLSDDQINILNRYTLRQFFITPYKENISFYDQFEKRLLEAYKALAIEG